MHNTTEKLINIHNCEINECHNSITFPTDFEYLDINSKKISRLHFNTNENSLIRFIDDDYLLDFPISGDKLHQFYFLPSHVEEKIKKSLDDEVIIPEYEYLYPENLKSSFEKKDYIYTSNEKQYINSSTYPNYNESEYSTSFFTIKVIDDNLNREEYINLLLQAVNELKKHPAFTDHLAYIGHINENEGLLYKGKNPKSKQPNTVHCDFWKTCSNISNITFEHISQSFVSTKSLGGDNT